MPTLPTVVFQVMELVQSQESDAKRLAEIIEHDPSLSAKILRSANSVFFAPVSQRISSVQLAVARLGFDAVKNLALAIGLIRNFPQRTGSLNHVAFWRHSVAVAYLSELIAQKASSLSPDINKHEFFISGLLHDIGILAYDQYFHDRFASVMAGALQEGKSYIEAEKDLAGKETHGFLGGALLELWRLNSRVVSAVRYHHAPSEGPGSHIQETSVVYLAEHIFCNSRIASFEGAMPESADEVYKTIGLTPDSRTGILQQAETEVAKHSALIAQEAHKADKGLRKI